MWLSPSGQVAHTTLDWRLCRTRIFILSRFEKEDTDTSIEHVKELEAELHELRIENAFLKELRRLRLEDEAKMRERRESSTVSEENSN